VVRTLAPTTAEDLPLSAQECADRHLIAQLRESQARQLPTPCRVEVRVWQDESAGPPAAEAIWDIDSGILHPQ
jgi:hypothetical protein